MQVDFNILKRESEDKALIRMAYAMIKAYFRFYEELNDFLPIQKRKMTFAFEFKAGENVQSVIQKIGVPHTEIDLILVNGESVGFSYVLQSNDQVSVYPVFETLDIHPIVKLHTKPLRVVRFIADSHLGKLAKYLRMLGFDTLYDNHYQDEFIVHLSVKEHRIIITRDKHLLHNTHITHGYWLREDEPRMQLKEIVQHFQLTDIKPFSRCLECNYEIKPVQYEAIRALLPSDHEHEFKNPSQCIKCRKVYWEGSHYNRMQEFIKSIMTLPSH